MTKPKPLFFENYFSMIKNSEGSRMFQDFFAILNGKKKNLTQKGRLSCAFFVSSILYHFSLIKAPHLTVEGTLKDMKNSGWFEIKKPKKGCVILWEKKKGHFHLGFCLSSRKAISNSRQKRVPILHSIDFSGKRKIISFFWHKKLDKKVDLNKK
mgnify:CR=1 FL=1